MQNSHFHFCDSPSYRTEKSARHNSYESPCSKLFRDLYFGVDEIYHQLFLAFSLLFTGGVEMIIIHLLKQESIQFWTFERFANFEKFRQFRARGQHGYKPVLKSGVAWLEHGAVNGVWLQQPPLKTSKLVLAPGEISWRCNARHLAVIRSRLQFANFRPLIGVFISEN